ncbi:MAG: DUF418 domain-containing protein [Planctomycetota bacterium]|jgi:uncharacterized protein
MTEAGPVTQPERIASLDVLRGVAVLGILVMNIQSFSMPGAAYMNPSAYGDLEGVNHWVWYLSHLLTDQKFWTIFSMLFGAGIVLMTSRAEAAGRGSAGVHYRRMAWLLLFGLLHAHLIWYGDILYSYAMCGFVAYLFRKLPPWLLILLGLVAVSVTSGVNLFFGWMLVEGHMPAEQATMWWSPAQDVIDGELATYRGGWLGQLPHRMGTAIFFETFLFLVIFGWRTGGIILIGMALYKLGVFSAARSKGFYAVLVALGALAGVPIIMFGAARNLEVEWDVMYSFYFGSLYNYWASIVVSLGWVGLVMLVCKSNLLGFAKRVLAAVGQMALTNYLMQSIICTTIFYGHGFGAFGHFERTHQILTVVSVWVVQLIWSPIWMRSFRFGPFEWLWRSLTYLKPQPMRR